MKASLQALYARAIGDTPRMGCELGNYNRSSFVCGSPFNRPFTEPEIEYFQRWQVDVKDISKSHFGDGILISIISGEDIKAAFEGYATRCIQDGRKPFLTDKISAHLARLTSPRREHLQAERIFGREMLRNKYRINNLLAKRDRNSFGNGTITGEGYATTMFWTFAPYLYKALTEAHGLAADRAVMMIASWPFKLGSEATRLEADNIGLLLGLEGLLEPVFLGDDPDGPSHEFTRLKAEEVAQKLVGA